MVNLEIQSATSPFSAAPNHAAAPLGAVTFAGALMPVTDADTTKGSHAWSPPA
jgi:hypothetical protein